MQVYLKRFSVVAGFSVLILVLVAGAFFVHEQIRQQVSAQFWVNHTRRVLLQLETTESLLKDAETGQRGLLLTSDELYLQPYNSARAQLSSHIDNLAALVADDPVNESSVAELRNLATEKMAELQQTVDLFHSGRSADAKEVVLSDRGKVIMDQIRVLVAQMRAEEQSLQATRDDDYARSIRITRTSVFLLAGIGIVGLFGLAFVILRDIRRTELHAREIRAREEWFRVTLTSIGDAVIATDRNGRVTFLNPVAEKLTGRGLGEVAGTPIVEVFPIYNEFTGAKSENPVQSVLENGHVVGLANHTVLEDVDGKRIPIEDSAAPIRDDGNNLIGVVLVFRDVTHERKSQELLRRTEKLSAAARLSATVAHEINNPLEAVSNLIYLAKITPGASSELIGQLTLAEQELARVAHITRQTLGFYRESNDPRPMEIAPVIDSVLDLYANKLRTKEITVDRRYEQCPPIIGVPGEIRQAISNLLSNAVDAVSERGNIVLSLSCLDQPGDKYVHIAFEDDGPGISAENVDRIFEPFFTTKRNVGTGLGLYVTREIVERHGGTLEVRQNGHHRVLSGACFLLRLPCDPDPRALESLVPPA